ncbi:MAG: anhydro-N-acetylmuramic acid kinase [Candidatus Sericytochromatia bacterium]|nr:anhydro-N-acetylmuramic acid kinase [Candidatus Tanganyikabacteria bacterium]
MLNRLRVLGLMSGTSADGVDVARVLFWTEDGRIRHKLEAHLTVPHPEGLGARIRAAGPQTPLEEVARLDVAVAESLAAAVRQAQATWCTPDAGTVDLIGSHGQTVLHLPGLASIQIGTPARIAALTGVTTVGDFRTADLAVGGQGAPLVPHADEVFYGSPDADELLLNLGGIANLTVLPAGGPAVGWDTGPANMVLDGLAMTLLGTPCDRDGEAAARGQVHDGLLARLLEDPYFVAPPPKSTGRERFGAPFVGDLIGQGQALGLSTDDLLATATALTVQTVVLGFEAWRRRPEASAFAPRRLRVAGGGVRNVTLMAGLGQAFAKLGIAVEVLPDAEAREAVAFALFAYEAVLGRANHAPAATGAHRPVLLGTVAPGANYQRVLLAMPWQAAPSGLPMTERRHPATHDLDRRSGRDLAELFAVEEDAVAQALRDAAPDLGRLVAAAAERFARGGRLIYLGAGTSGRLGVLDAAECPPTFSTPPDRVLAFIAGGPAALVRAVEGAEDQGALGVADLEGCGVGPDDVVIGLSASGGAAYVREGLAHARRVGALTGLVTCVPQQGRWEGGDPPVDHGVTLLTGPELLTGSTRLKAGTATKVALNALSTGVMVLTGKTWGNLMVDVSVSNVKLRDRAIRIVAEIVGRDRAEAERLLDAASGKVRLAAAMGILGTDAAEATRRLHDVGGRLALLEARA